MTYVQPELPYAEDALAPAISQETVEYHYGKHEKAYIDNLNRLIKDTEYEDMELEDIIRTASGALFNNASQAWNHIFYFFSFSPDGPREPEGHLKRLSTSSSAHSTSSRKLSRTPAPLFSVQAGYGFRKTTTASSS